MDCYDSGGASAGTGDCRCFRLYPRFGELGDKLLAVVNALFAALTILGIVTDPTTAGIGDSKQALTYETPKKEDAV